MNEKFLHLFCSIAKRTAMLCNADLRPIQQMHFKHFWNALGNCTICNCKFNQKLQNASINWKFNKLLLYSSIAKRNQKLQNAIARIGFPAAADYLEDSVTMQVNRREAIGTRWIQVDPGGSKWIQVDPGRYRWIQVDLGGPRWIQVEPGGWEGTRGSVLSILGFKTCD